MGRPRPKLLHEKLLAIREFLSIRQSHMADRIRAEILAHSGKQQQIQRGQICHFEKGNREPSLFVLIAYIHLGHVHMGSLVDDEVTLDDFRKRLGKEFDHATLKRPTSETAVPEELRK
ncbi:MAG TPA: hypothetical protein VJP89_20435 [Pyrinomonadaceae bacterium]|nr:hypothetical protein [Pyrinomonadaceae bacterium]